MRSVGQERLLRGQKRVARLDQVFDLRCRVVKALGQKADFVVAFHPHAHRQVAVAPALHAGLQAFQAAGKAAHDGIGCQGHRSGHQGQGTKKAKGRNPGAARRAGQVQMHGLPVLQAHHKLWPTAEMANVFVGVVGLLLLRRCL